MVLFISVLSYNSYSYGAPLGNTTSILNQTCAQFCLYKEPFDDPGERRDNTECNAVSSQSQCSHGLTDFTLDPCNIAYGNQPSNTYSIFGYPLLNGPGNIYGEAVCKCKWNINACVPDSAFNPISVDTGSKFCDTTGNFSGVAGNIILNRGYFNHGTI